LLAGGILERLEKHTNTTANPLGEAVPDPAMDQKTKEKERSFVKVTTVKYLAQLLGDSEIVPEAFAMSILEKLNQVVSHVDIRRQIMNTLLNKLKTSSASSAERSIVVIESAIPLLGNIRERQPLHQGDWEHTSETLQLPSLNPVYSLTEDSPMLTLLLTFLKDQLHANPNFVHSVALMKRIILPVVEHLKKETKQWVRVHI
jgi:hypothetical protein